MRPSSLESSSVIIFVFSWYDCNALRWEADTKTCSYGAYEPSLTVQPEDGGSPPLVTAWSFKKSFYNPADFAIDRNIHFNSFSSSHGETFPWLALDLHFPRLVSRVIIISSRDNVTQNIEARVGYLRPFYPGMSSGQLYSYNTVCGEVEGPGLKTLPSIINCSEPLEGRYVTLQTKKR